MEENIYNYVIVTAGDMSANITSPLMDTSVVEAIVFYAKWTGSPVGTIKLQVSLTELDADFIDLDDSEQVVNGAGNFMWNVTDTNYDKIRLVYTFGSGTGSLEVRVNAKGDRI